jgi:hypothetical protein
MIIVGEEQNKRYELVVACFSEQLKIAFNHYGVVGSKIKCWEAVEIPEKCEGFCELDSIFVIFKKGPSENTSKSITSSIKSLT